MKQFFSYLKKILNITGKFFLVISVFVIIINLFLIFTSTNREKINFSKINEQNRTEIYKNINDKKMNSTKEGKTAIAWYRLINCAFIGEACTNNPSDGKANFNGSVFGYITQGIALPYFNPPASGVYWVYDTLQNNNLVPKSYAAEGIGFAALKPLIGLWKIFRNAAYLILVIVLISIGFMIMFRVKLNPQTVISLENSLPRIVVTLLLITFSFPIAGFMIDFMYVVMAFSIMLFSGYIDVTSSFGILSGDGWSLFDKIFLNSDVFQVGYKILEILPASTGNFIRFFISVGTVFLLFKIPGPAKNIPTGEVAEGLGALSGKFISTTIGMILTPIITVVAYWLAPLLLGLVVLLTSLVIFLRILILIFKSFIKILLLIIFSPFIFLIDAIPGRKMTISWLKNMTANLITFPIVSTLIILSSVLSNYDQAERLWSPPFLYSTNTTSMSLLIGVGILFMIPDIVKLVQGAIGIKDSGLKGPRFFGAASATAGGIMGAGGKYMNLRYQGQFLPAGLRQWLEKIPGARGLSDESIKRRNDAQKPT